MNELLRRMLFLPPQASSLSRSVDHLHYVVVLSAMLGATIVALFAIVFVIRFRRGSRAAHEGKTSVTPWFERSMVVGILGFFIALWVVGVRQYADMRRPPDDALTIYVTAKQWMWKFTYPDGRGAIDELVVPANKPVKLLMTSRDVIHSFYVPAFRLKQDVLPGRYTMLWFEAVETGTFPVYCAEYCGLSHSEMLGKVTVMKPEDYDEWLRKGAGEASVATPLVARGREVAEQKQCVACHTLDGKRHVGPTWRGLYGSSVKLRDGRTVLADDAYLTRSMMDPNADVVAGFEPVMPTFAGNLSPGDAAALVELIRSLREPAPPDVTSQDLVDGGVVPASVPADGGSTR